MINGFTLLAFVFSLLSNTTGAVLCGCGPHKFIEKSQDFIVYQLPGRSIRLRAETTLPSKNISWGIFQGKSGLSSNKIANLYRTGIFERVGKGFRFELLNETYGGILSKWVFRRTSEDNTVYAEINTGCNYQQIKF